MNTFEPEKTALLIDGSSFLYRAYYALKPMHTPDGMTIHAVFGFCRMLKKLLDSFKPAYCLIAWDSKGPSSRSAIYTEYKATRQAAPSDLFSQKELIKEFADIIGMLQLEVPGIEADDLLYSAAGLFKKEGFSTLLVTTDKDLAQAVGDNVYMYDAFKEAVLTQADLEQKYGLPLSKLPFYFALIGDSSDNIPGVRGIGPKTAQELVNNFESLEDLYNNLEKVPKERIRELLRSAKDDAFMSEKLFTLQALDLGIIPQQAHFAIEQWLQAREFFGRLSFKSLLKDLPQSSTEQSEIAPRHTVAHRLSFSLKPITKKVELDALVELIKQKRAVAIDTETNSLNALQAQLVGISLCVEQDAGYYIPCAHTTGEEQLPCEVIVTALKPLFADITIKKYMHHAKYDMHVLTNAGLSVQGLVFDTLLAASLVTRDWQRIGLKYLSEHYLHEPMLSFSEVVLDKGYKNFQQVPLQAATLYAASDAHQTWALVPILKNELTQHAQAELYADIEFPLVELLIEMEQEGIYCDVSVIEELDKYLTADIKKIREHIIDLIGENYNKINLNSPKQLSTLLFEDLKLMPVKKTGQKTNFSTDQEVLLELAKSHPVPALIVKHRELFKLKSTYIDTLPGFINPKTGRIHTSFSQTTAATGRLASSEPNMQNVPPLVRKAFKPREGYAFLSADYSQIELRVLAYLSQDATLLRAFERGEDVHKRTAVALYSVPFEDVTSEQRQIAKRINFSILYGMTPFGLSKDLDIPFNTAKDYIDRFMGQYPGVQQWMEEVVQETEKYGYVTTHWGRRRYLPGIYEKNRTLYDLARRMAINTKGQGTAAEIMKLGMLAVKNSLLTAAADAKIILQIHDELLLEVNKDDVERVQQLVKQTLEGVVKWNVPLVVTTHIGNDWHELK